MTSRADTYGVEFLFNSKGAQKSLGALGTVTGRATEKLKAMTDQKGYLYYSMKRIASYTAIFTFFTGLIKIFSDVVELELRMAEVSTLIDKTNQDAVRSFDQVSQALLKLDPHLGNSIDLTKGLYEIISAGVTDPVQAFDLLVVAAKYAKVGLTDLATASSTLTAVMKAYGYQAKEMRAVSDILFASVREGKYHTDELNDAIGKVLPTAAAMNVDITEVAAAMAIMTQRGLDVNEAATSLNRMMISFLRPIDKAKKEFQRLGWQWGINAFEGKGLIGALQDLEEATAKYSDLLPIIFRRQRALKGGFLLQGEGLRQLEDAYVRYAQAEKGAGIVHAEFGRITQTVKEEAKAMHANILQAFSGLLKYKGVLAEIIRMLSGVLRFVLENSVALMAFATSLLAVRKAYVSLTTGILGVTVGQRAFAAATIGATSSTMALTRGTTAAAAAIGGISSVLSTVGIILAAAAAAFVIVKTSIDRHTKALEITKQMLKDTTEEYTRVTEDLQHLADIYKDVTGKTLEFKEELEVMSEVMVFEVLKKDLEELGKKATWKKINDALKAVGFSYTEANQQASAFIGLLDSQSKEAKRKVSVTEKAVLALVSALRLTTVAGAEFAANVLDTTPQVAAAFRAERVEVNRLGKAIKDAAASYTLSADSLIFRFDKDELTNMLKSVRQLYAGGISENQASALATLFGLDLEKAKEELQGFEPVLREAVGSFDKVMKESRMEDATRELEASWTAIVYTLDQAREAAEVHYNFLKSKRDESKADLTAYAEKHKDEFEKILRSREGLNADMVVLIEEVLSLVNKEAAALERQRKKIEAANDQRIKDRDRMNAVLSTSQNKFMDEEYKNVGVQWKKMRAELIRNAEERFRIEKENKGKMWTALKNHLDDMALIRAIDEAKEKEEQFERVEDLMKSNDELLRLMKKNKLTRLKFVKEARADAIDMLHFMGIESDQFFDFLLKIINEYYDKQEEAIENSASAMSEEIKILRNFETAIGKVVSVLDEFVEELGLTDTTLGTVIHGFSSGIKTVLGMVKAIISVLEVVNSLDEALEGLDKELASAIGTAGVFIAIFMAAVSIMDDLSEAYDKRFEARKFDAFVEAVDAERKAVGELTVEFYELVAATEDYYEAVEAGSLFYHVAVADMSEYEAYLLNLGKAIDETGLSLHNFGGYVQEANDLINFFKQGSAAAEAFPEAAAAAFEVLENVFSTLISFAKTHGLEGSKDILDLFRNAREEGMMTASMIAYVHEQLKSAAQGLEMMISGIERDAIDSYREVKKLIDQKEVLSGDLEYYLKLMEGLEEGTDAWEDMRDKVEGVREQIAGLDEDILKLQGGIGDITQVTADKISRMGIIAAGVFSAMLSDGVPLYEIFESMGGSIYGLMDRFEAFGLEVPEYLKPIFALFSAFEDNPDFLEGFQGLQQVFAGLGNSAWLTQEMFGTLLDEAKEYYNTMIKGKDQGGFGLPEEEAIRMLYPMLQQAWWYAEQYGFKLPEWMAEAVDKAKSFGLKFEKPAVEQQLEMLVTLTETVETTNEILTGGFSDLLHSLQGVGTFQHGAPYVPGGLARLHPGESVLPENVTTALRKFFIGRQGELGEGGGSGVALVNVGIDGNVIYRALAPFIKQGVDSGDLELSGEVVY